MTYILFKFVSVSTKITADVKKEAVGDVFKCVGNTSADLKKNSVDSPALQVFEAFLFIHNFAPQFNRSLLNFTYLTFYFKKLNEV